MHSLDEFLQLIKQEGINGVINKSRGVTVEAFLVSGFQRETANTLQDFCTTAP